MTMNYFKTKYFIAVLALILLLPAGINSITAQEQTDEEILQEYYRMFGNSTVIEEGQPIPADTEIGTYAPVTEIPDEIKIDVLRSLEQTKHDTGEFDKFVEKQVEDRKPLLKTVTSLLETIKETDDPQHKAILKKALEDLKPLMAEHGIFLDKDKDNRKFVDLWLEKSEIRQENFRSTKKDVSYDSTSHPIVTNITVIMPNKISDYVQYSCSYGLTCKIGPEIWYSNTGGATVIQRGTIPDDIAIVSIAEWITEIKNQQSGTVYQGSYHTGSHFDSEWNFQSANTKSLNL